jgi:bifunctional DNA-binding transcriptional regulator/antitoxin component of YhaV-PrlF toxin-antitoxin module
MASLPQMSNTIVMRVYSSAESTLPIDLREKYKLEKGKMLSIIDLGDGKMLLTTKASRLNQITARIEENLNEENVTFDNVLEQLDEERKIYNRECYPSK